MSKRDTNLDDIAEAINGLATLMDKRFDQVDKRFDQVDKRFDQVDSDIRSLRTDVREMHEWLERIDNRLFGVESDIKEIYDRIVALEAKAPNLTNSNKQTLEQDIAALFEWAKKVSQKTGIALPKM